MINFKKILLDVKQKEKDLKKVNINILLPLKLKNDFQKFCDDNNITMTDCLKGFITLTIAENNQGANDE